MPDNKYMHSTNKSEKHGAAAKKNYSKGGDLLGHSGLHRQAILDPLLQAVQEVEHLAAAGRAV